MENVAPEKLEIKEKNRTWQPYILLTIYSVVLTGISYISINSNSQIYDYPFHMARIVGLAQSISHGDWLPNLNYLFTHGSGYTVPMFYGNAILYLPALVYLMTKVGTLAFPVMPSSHPEHILDLLL